jgi:hypothetical protein
MSLDDDYYETVDQLWDVWYKEGINLSVHNKRVFEKWLTEWSEKDKKNFSSITFIVEYIQAHSEGEPVGLLIAELEKLQGNATKQCKTPSTQSPNWQQQQLLIAEPWPH